MTSVAAISPVRVAAIQPAVPGPGLDPYEDGLEVEVVTEPPVVLVHDDDRVGAVDRSSDAGTRQAQRTPSAWSPPQVGAVASLLPTAPGPGGPLRGNASVSTGFDATPAPAVDAPRAPQSASPVARAYAAYSSR